MSIPASVVVRVNPGVIVSGGNSLALNELFLTQSPLMPAGKVYNFTSLIAVQNFFGLASDEAALAAIYFKGYDNSTIKPGGMLFSSYNAANRAAFLQSGNLAGLSLTALKALTGVLTIVQDGVSKTSSAINLSAATSFSNAATLIAAAFTSGPAVTWNPVNSTFLFTSPTTGLSSSMSYATGSLAAGLALTQALGAIVSIGAVADTPSSAMTFAVAQSQNFATFQTVFEPILSDKLLFAQWSNSQNSRFLYLGWDSDAQASVQGSTASFGAMALAAAYDGVIALSGDPALAVAQGTTLAITARNLAAFLGGAIASINFNQRNGRITAMFRSQAGLLSTVEDQQLAANLTANGYSYYGAYATANQNFVFFANGALTGKWAWVDNFINQVYLNSQFQLTLLTLLTQIGSVSYTPAGYNLIRSAMGDPISAALIFGSIRTGVVLSASQIAAVNQAAGVDAASVIQTEGYYLQILDPGATARGIRQTPIINFWYTDGGAVQQITLASIDIL